MIFKKEGRFILFRSVRVQSAFLSLICYDEISAQKQLKGGKQGLF